jgi:hypothetical protein
LIFIPDLKSEILVTPTHELHPAGFQIRSGNEERDMVIGIIQESINKKDLLTIISTTK